MDKNKIILAALKFICGCENFSATPYLDSAKILTIGHGLTEILGRKVQMCDVISEEESMKYVQEHIERNLKMLESLLDLNSLTLNQIVAILSFIYNSGESGFRTSTLLKDLKARDFQSAVEEFKKWCHVTVDGKKEVCKGLVNRRLKEVKLFNSRIEIAA